TRGIAEALPRNRRACMTLAEAAGPAHAHLRGSGGTGGAVHRTHRSQPGGPAPGHRPRPPRAPAAVLSRDWLRRDHPARVAPDPSPTGRAAPGHRSRLLRSLGADLRQGLLERGHRRLGVLVAGCRRILSNLLDQRIRRTVLDEFRIELGVGVLIELVEIIVVQE